MAIDFHWVYGASLYWNWEWHIRALNVTFVLFYRKIHTWSARQTTRTFRVTISTRDSVWICCERWQTFWSFPSGSSWWMTGCMELQNLMGHGLAWWGNSSTGYACLLARLQLSSEYTLCRNGDTFQPHWPSMKLGLYLLLFPLKMHVNFFYMFICLYAARWISTLDLRQLVFPLE